MLYSTIGKYIHSVYGKLNTKNNADILCNNVLSNLENILESMTKISMAD